MLSRSRVLTITMSSFVILLIALVAVGLVMGLGRTEKSTERSFTIDHKANTFLMDGKPFRYVSGSFHYFRALPGAWQNRLRTMRAAGLNAVDTYVEWSLHNPYDGVYDWSGIADIERFIELAQEEGFYVILRPGPYICAERDNGGLPHWLFTKYPNIKVRTNDANFTNEVAIWYGQLMPRLQRFLYSNGGSIIMVQVENEYGGFHTCDRDYLNWLRDETEKYVQKKALLFTTDIPDANIRCGKIEGVFATTDFGGDRIHEIDNIWKTLRSVQPTGPLVNSEFYPGWLTHWQEENQRRDAVMVAGALSKILEYGASVNFYMFFGGTNFGFTAGANDVGFGKYTPDITSYDYDAVMDEAGNVTQKYDLVRDVIKKYLEIPKLEPSVTKAVAYGKIQLHPIMGLLTKEGRETLAKGNPMQAALPKTFEELDQYSGLVLYETTLPNLEIDPTLLTVNKLHDRAYVYVDGQFMGTLSRSNRIYSLPLNKGCGSRLQLLVENQGRINFYVADDTKGILGDVTVQKLNGKEAVLSNWTTTAFPLEEPQIHIILKRIEVATLQLDKYKDTSENLLLNGPVLYYGELMIDEVADTYLNTSGWGKGVAYINGFNLGRYWPLAGPQITLYVPQESLKKGLNTLILVEYQRVNRETTGEKKPFITFDAVAQLDG